MLASTYISRSACRGKRPSQLSTHTFHARPHLVSRLLQNRSVVRFISAPFGYGKTSLVLEYAETVHFWQHCFWINAQSPCFVRDLDAQSIESSCFLTDEHPALLIFEDLPCLNRERQQAFSHLIDTLLKQGCEVLVTCCPASDLPQSLQPERLLITPSDLLLCDTERAENTEGEKGASAITFEKAFEQSRVASDAAASLNSSRVPLLAWSKDKNKDKIFVEGLIDENLSDEALCTLVCMLVLQKGSLNDINDYISAGDDVIDFLSGAYPHLGIKSKEKCFLSEPLCMEDIGLSLKRISHQVLASSRFDRIGDLIQAWSEKLIAHEQATRACELISAFCSLHMQVRWVIAHAQELLRQFCLFPALKLITDRKNWNSDLRARSQAFEALLRRLLGDEPSSLICAKRVAFKEGVPQDARILALLLLCEKKVSTDELLSEKAYQGLKEMLRTSCTNSLQEAVCHLKESRLAFWDVLVYARVALVEKPEVFSSLWLDLSAFDEAKSDNVRYALLLMATWLFSDVNTYLSSAEAGFEQSAEKTELICRRAQRYVCEQMAQSMRDNKKDSFATSACLSLEAAHRSGLALEDGSLSTHILLVLRQAEMEVAAQRQAFCNYDQIQQTLHQEWVNNHPATSFKKSDEKPVQLFVKTRRIPTLKLRSFGCFEASIGDNVLEYESFKRGNSRSLLVLLALNQGKELSRNTVSEAMWPNSSSSVAHKNFYTIWGYLRRALSLSDGSCPYLIRHQYGCSIDARFVQSDIDRFNEICRELLFSTPDIEHLSLLFSEIDRDFSNDLMPSEHKNALILQARASLRGRLVDALVAATSGIIESGNPRWGVWFARAAIERDETREDAYVALMQAQIAGNQRTAAMMTYLNCRRVLAERLGIDPSPETKTLYESLLE